jgi:hypothetical protein
MARTEALTKIAERAVVPGLIRAELFSPAFVPYEYSDYVLAVRFD